MDETQPHVGLTPVVTSYATATHPKPHKKMIIDKYIPTIEAAQKIADEALILRVAKTASVKQYKGKRDPSAKRPTITRVEALDQMNREKDVQIIDLSKSSTNHTPGSTKTVYSDEAVELSTCHTMNTSADGRLGVDATHDPTKAERPRHLVRSAIEALERSMQCMSTLDRVRSWRVSADQSEVEEFCSVPLSPYREYLIQYAADLEFTCSSLAANHNTRANDSPTLLRVDYTKKLNGNTPHTLNQRVAVRQPFKVPHQPSESPAMPTDDSRRPPLAELTDAIVIDSNSSDSNSSYGEDVQIVQFPLEHHRQPVDKSGSSDSHKEEFYKYLGIDTNPVHSRDTAAAKETHLDEMEARCKRRSLRVKVQQIAINNRAKFQREKESIEQERGRVDDSFVPKEDQPLLQSQRKTLIAGKKSNKLNGSSSVSSKRHRLLLSVGVTPKDRRLLAAAAVHTSSTSASSRNSTQLNHRNGSVAQTKPVINSRGRGRPRKLVEPAVKQHKSNHLADKLMNGFPNRRHSHHAVIVGIRNGNVSRTHDGNEEAASMRTTSSASPYPQTMSSNELPHAQSEKNFTSDERASTKSSPLIVNRFSSTLLPPPSKKVSLLERRNYSKSAQTTADVKSGAIQSSAASNTANYCAKVLMGNRKPVEAVPLVLEPSPIAIEQPSPPTPISERLQMRQLQRLAELENTKQRDTLHHTDTPKSLKPRNPVLKIILQRQKLSSNLNKLRLSKNLHSPENLGQRGKVTAEQVGFNPIASKLNSPEPPVQQPTDEIILPTHTDQNETAPPPDRLLSPIKQQQKAITQLSEMGILPKSATAVPIRKRRLEVSARVRRLTNLRISLRAHRPRRSASMRRHAGLVDGHPAAKNERRSLHRVIHPASILRRREHPKEESPYPMAMEETDKRLDGLPDRASSTSGSFFLGFDETERQSIMSLDTIDDTLPPCKPDDSIGDERQPSSQMHRSATSSVKSPRSTTPRRATPVSSRLSVDSAIGTSDHKNINDLVLAAVADIIGVAPVVCTATPIACERVPSPCGPMVNSNPLRAESGAVLAVVRAHAGSDVVVVVQEREVSFWRQPSRVFDIFGVTQHWTCHAGIARRTEDTEVQSPYQNRVLFHDDQSVYVECRAKQFHPTATRDSHLCAVYLNVYLVDMHSGEARMNMIDLDKISAVASSIRYTVISGLETSVVVSWTEKSVQRTRCGFCKYNLTPELDLLDLVNEYSFAEHAVLSLSCFDEDKLLVLGETSVMLWDYRTGDMLLNLDVNQPLGVSLGGFIADERSTRFMFLIQLVQVESPKTQRLELLAINLSDCFSIKVIQSHDIPVDFANVSTFCVSPANHVVVTFTSGHSVLMSLGNPRHIHLRPPKSRDLNALACQSFALHDQIVQVFEDRMRICTICDHFHVGA